MRDLWAGLGQLCFPPACAICREPHVPAQDGIVCNRCLVRLVPLAHPLCSRCGHPRLSLAVPGPPSKDRATGAPPVLSPCRWCTRLEPYVRAVRSVCRMDEGTGTALVHALKYGGWPAVALPMARRMSRLPFPDDVVRERTALVPLPLSPVRQRERGHNQAERLAAGLATHWTLPVWCDVLERTRDTKSQVRLTPSERLSNVSRAFAVRRGAMPRLRGAHVMLVDDVITTAASLNAAAAALMEGGARIISYVTFGRAPDPGDRTGSDFDLDRD
jgi:ComF family protein